jgi:hypothetical protein
MHKPNKRIKSFAIAHWDRQKAAAPGAGQHRDYMARTNKRCSWINVEDIIGVAKFDQYQECK